MDRASIGEYIRKDKLFSISIFPSKFRFDTLDFVFMKTDVGELNAINTWLINGERKNIL